jgi:hypothetical protein
MFAETAPDFGDPGGWIDRRGDLSLRAGAAFFFTRPTRD